MLRQQINLFKPFDSSGNDISLLTWKRFLKLNAIFSGILTFFLLISAIRYYHVASIYSELKTSQTAIETEMTHLKKIYPSIFFTEDISKTLENLKQKIEEEKALLSSTSTTQTFSGDLLALADMSIDGVWLTNITLTRNGKDITLKGNSVSIDHLQSYISKIMHEPRFADYTLHINNIMNPISSKDKKAPMTFDFHLTKKSA